MIDAVEPSRVAKLVLGPMTRVLNPVIRKLAGHRYFPTVGLVCHVGRRSGKFYVTPVGAHVDAVGTILVPLTFGNTSDWVRNVRAAGQCAVRLGGHQYHAVRPQFVEWSDFRPLVRAAFNPVMRVSFRLLGIQQFLRLQTERT
jgi:deazaflavin-dependent oxidoreductase (nitroreductase family)